MANISRPNDLQIENARLIYRNFKGEESRYNAKGNRNFCVRLTNEQAHALANAGWNVKFPKQPEDGKYEREPFLMVTVKYGRIQDLWPQVYVKPSKVAEPVKYTEEMIGELDSVDFDRVDLIIRPRIWTDDYSGETHIKAYLNRMYATMSRDNFYDRFFNPDMYEDEGTLPFDD